MEKKRSIWVAIAIFVLPALLAGVFAIIPRAFDWAVSPKAKLTYSMINGPAISNGAGFSSIYSVEIQNSGSKKLSNIRGSIRVSGGKVDRAVLGGASADGTILNMNPDGTATISVNSLFPKEKISATIMLSSVSPASGPTFSVRSDDALGEPLSAVADNKSDQFFSIALFPAVGSLFASGLVAWLMFSRMGSYRSVLSALKIGIDKDDSILYPLYYLGDDCGVGSGPFSVDAVTYALTSDMILRKALSVPQNQRAKYSSALKGMLLAPKIHPGSRGIMIDNIRQIDVDFDDNKLDDLMKLSDKIADLAEYRLALKKLFDEV